MKQCGVYAGAQKFRGFARHVAYVPGHRTGNGKVADGESGKLQTRRKFFKQIGPVLYIEDDTRSCPQTGKQGKRPAFRQKPDILRPEGGRLMIFIEEKIAVLLEKYGNGCGKSGIPGGKFSFFPQDEKDGISFIFSVAPMSISTASPPLMRGRGGR